MGGRYAVLTLHGPGGSSEPGAEAGSSAGGGGEDGTLLDRWAEDDCGRRLAEGDVRRLLAHEDVPPYLELPLLSALHSLHREEAALCPSHWVEPVFDQKRARDGADDWTAALKQRNAAYQDSVELTEKEKTKLILAEAYGSVVNTQKGCAAIARMNEIHAAMLEEVINKSEAAISELHQKQSEEMNKAAGDGGEISSLVARHVKQMELTERKWGAKLEDMRKQQKRAYGRCIVRWATEGLPNKVNADVLHEFKAAKKQGGGSLTASPLARKKSDLQHPEQRGSPGGREQEGKKRWWNKKKGGEANEGPDSPQLRSSGSVGQQPQQQQPQPQYQVPALASAPSGSTKWEHFTVLLGRSKALHHFGLGAGDITQFCRLRASSEVRAQTIRDLYSHSLNAIVLVVDRGLTYTNKVNKEFVRCCGASPEAHFSDFQKQLQLVKDELGRPMQPGDVFITRHSNLEAAHIAFHLVGDNDPVNNFTVDSPQVQGLRSILAIAHDYDVGTISLPIILKELQSEVESSNRVEDCTRAAEVVVKSVKSFLNDKAAAEDASLKVVQFLCGSAFFAPYLNTLNNVCGRFAK